MTLGADLTVDGRNAATRVASLPNGNTTELLSIGTITDATQVQHVRRALPLDGMPGGGAEWVFPGGSPLDGSLGRVLDQTIPFTLP